MKTFETWTTDGKNSRRCDGVDLHATTGGYDIEAPWGLSLAQGQELLRAVRPVTFFQVTLRQEDLDGKLFHVPWDDLPRVQRLVDDVIPLQPIEQVVVREFNEDVAGLQALRREGWTFLWVERRTGFLADGPPRWYVLAERKEMVQWKT